MKGFHVAVRTTAPVETEAQAIKKQDVWLAFAGLLVAMLLSSLDQVVLSTALPTIVGDLRGVSQMQWVTTAYILAATIAMPIYGKLGDLTGRKVLFISALVMFLCGSVIGGLSTKMAVLIAGRAIQGLGGGGLMILAQAIIADVVPPRQRGTYMGVMGAVFGVSTVIGPILGGWFTDSIGWRWAFWLNLPLGLVAVGMAVAFLKMPKHDIPRPKIDIRGIAAMVVAVTSIVLVSSMGGVQYEWGSVTILALIALAVVSGVIFILVERRAAEPLMPLHLFRNRNFDLATIGGLFMAIAMFGAVGYMPSYLQMVTGLSAMKSGFLLLPMMVGLMSTTLMTGGLANRTGRYKWMPIASFLIAALGLFLLSTLRVDASLWRIGVYLFIFGAGLGLGMQILVLIVQNAFPITQVGTATAANNFFREIGSTLGSAIVGTVFTSRLMNLLAEKLPAAAGGTGSALDRNSLTPSIVDQLPVALRNTVVGAYNEALTPIFRYLLPLMLLGALILLFVKNEPLAITNEMSGR
jgi:EmrB/QacA subfamily drug resistance transporter